MLLPEKSVQDWALEILRSDDSWNIIRVFLTISNDAPTTLEPEINYLISTITPDWVMPRGVQIRRLSPAVRPVRSARELSDPITQNSFAQNHSKENQMRLNSSKETSEANLTHILRDRILKVLEHCQPEPHQPATGPARRLNTFRRTNRMVIAQVMSWILSSWLIVNIPDWQIDRNLSNQRSANRQSRDCGVPKNGLFENLWSGWLEPSQVT